MSVKMKEDKSKSMIPDRASHAENWELDKLVTMLLRQFKRLLADRDVELTDIQMRLLGEQVLSNATDDDVAARICKALTDIVQESTRKLGEWNLTFTQSLRTEMTDISGWESTAEFLDIANQKINAEIRITAGTSLLVIFGNYTYTDYLLQAIDYDLETHKKLDVDAIIAKHALIFASGVERDKSTWLDEVRLWLKTI